MIFEYFKPKFLTKEERAAEALKKRQDQVEAQRKKIQVCTITFPPPFIFLCISRLLRETKSYGLLPLFTVVVTAFLIVSFRNFVSWRNNNLAFGQRYLLFRVSLLLIYCIKDIYGIVSLPFSFGRLYWLISPYWTVIKLGICRWNLMHQRDLPMTFFLNRQPCVPPIISFFQAENVTWPNRFSFRVGI